MVNDLASRMHALACEIDDKPPETFVSDDVQAAMRYLSEALDAATRAGELPHVPAPDP
jgi:hypothetical protein